MRQDQIEKFQEYEVPDISDTLNRLYALDSAIVPLAGGGKKISGNVCTVRVYPGDNLMVHKVLDIVQPGDVVVIDGHGSQTVNAVLGDIICTKAKFRGIQGFIVDGLIRDQPGIAEIGIPVFARGTTPVGPLHRGPGEINYPISCGGIVINPGDVIVADECGVVTIPRENVDEILARLETHKAKQGPYLEGVSRGEVSNAWVDDLLAAQGCLTDTDMHENQ